MNLNESPKKNHNDDPLRELFPDWADEDIVLAGERLKEFLYYLHTELESDIKRKRKERTLEK